MTVLNKNLKLRFGIMCRGTEFSRWQAETITRLLAEEGIECSLLIIEGQNTWVKRWRYLKRKLKMKKGLWLIYAAYCQSRSRAGKKVSLAEVFKNTPIIKCQVAKKGKYSEYFSKEDLEEIEGYRLDFILKFGYGITRGEILQAAKYGVWSFHHGDELKYRGGPPGFWEIYHGEKVTGAMLQRLTDELDAGVVLKKGWLKTRRSYVRNRDQMFWASTIWPAQVCGDILNDQAGYVDLNPSTTEAPIYRTPTNLQFVNYVIKVLLRLVTAGWKRLLWHGYWNIGVVDKPIHNLIADNLEMKINWLPHLGSDRYRADPLAVVEGSKLQIFFEELVYREKRGKISYVSYKKGNFSQPEPVIVEPFHLSYPFVFKHGADYWLVPESFQANQVILYRAAKFPLKWKRERVIMTNFAGLDNTLFHDRNTWWLFSVSRDEGENSHLYIFYADNLKGEWQAHAQNPVKIDVQSARPAGPLFMYQGKLLRPAMDCSETYGGGVVINQVEKLTKTEYREVEYTRIEKLKSNAFADKLHTICPAGTCTLIDGFQENLIFKDLNSLKYLLYKAARVMSQKLTKTD